MEFIIEFYQGLDTINLILFWGIIIVLILLLMFSIIMVIRNNKLKEKLYEIEDNNDNDIPISNDDTPSIITLDNKEEPEKVIIKEPVKEVHIVEPVKEVIVEKPIITKEEIIAEKPKDDFVPEEYIKEYNEPKEEKTPVIELPKKEETRTPYSKNVLRGLSLNQTSPIGLTTNKEETEIEQAKELDETLKNEEYIEEVSKKLKDAAEEELKRTAYEIEEEENAVISYEELLKKKDSIKIVEEEDAVISYEELVERQKEQEKLYDINDYSEDEKFIKELKDFRHDL